MADRKTTGPSYSGRHAGKRRQITATDAQWEQMRRAAGEEPWAAWALRVLLEHASGLVTKQSNGSKRVSKKKDSQSS